MASIRLSKGSNQEAYKILSNLESLLESENLQQLYFYRIITLNYLGVYFRAKAALPKALEYFSQALSIIEKSELPFKKAQTLLNIYTVTPYLIG